MRRVAGFLEDHHRCLSRSLPRPPSGAPNRHNWGGGPAGFDLPLGVSGRRAPGCLDDAGHGGQLGGRSAYGSLPDSDVMLGLLGSGSSPHHPGDRLPPTMTPHSQDSRCSATHRMNDGPTASGSGVLAPDPRVYGSQTMLEVGRQERSREPEPVHTPSAVSTIVNVARIGLDSGCRKSAARQCPTHRGQPICWVTGHVLMFLQSPVAAAPIGPATRSPGWPGR
jgi:hypothetical protein